ncbi:MAG: Fic family protein [Armatimonadetes bacterium]|nr:Fic family protein [Armatimonadota bacterium]
MSTPAEKLAAALEKMHTAQNEGIVRSTSLSRTYLTRLTQAGFLQEIIRGWYFVKNPTLYAGSTAWYGYYWGFLRQYLTARFGEDYCLLPESSLHLLTGSTVVPRQLAIMRRSPGQQVLSLCLDTSLFIYQERGNFPERTVQINGVRVMELSEALLRVPESFFRSNPEDSVIALRMIHNPTSLISSLLENGRSVVGGRLAGAFRHLGDALTADRIVKTMQSAGYDIRESDPFKTPIAGSLSAARPLSPYVPRLQGMWANMRGAVIETFPAPPSETLDTDAYLAELEEKYVQDAYHSLSIEGYQATPTLIERVRKGLWNPGSDPADRETTDALAARGYWEAFRLVKECVRDILNVADTAPLVRRVHHEWHRALFSPSVQAGLLTPATLAGYRQTPVFIRGSRHVPLPSHALPDAMDTLFDLLAQEESPAVRAILGHFVFVFIHPYSDGNGRIGRFLMNAMFASGGYPWTIVHLENRMRYMEALEEASVHHNIRPFVACILDEMSAG